MTEPLHITDPYCQETTATVVGLTDQGGVILDRAIFYPQGGGQPGDTGAISWGDREMAVTNTIKGAGDAIILEIEPGAPLPNSGQEITQHLDWDRRHRHMRVHTGLHLLSVVIPLPVSGGAITAIKGRLDFDMPDALDNKEVLQDQLNDLIARDLEITESWITDAELDANPGLVNHVREAANWGRARASDPHWRQRNAD